MHASATAVNVNALSGCDAMPTLLPKKPQARAIERNQDADRLATAAVAVGFFGLFLAAILYLATGDHFIATYVMFVAAAIAMLMLRWDEGPPARD